MPDIDEKENVESAKTNNKKDCRTCDHYELIMGIKPVCNYWLVGFDMRGYEPCEEYFKKE